MSKKEIYETELPHRAVAVYLYLKDRANKEGTCYPAIGTIARELHLSGGERIYTQETALA